MTVLVVAASRHGGTWEIAETIAAGLCDAGRDADLVRLVDETTDPNPAGYEAAVLGSAVYGAHWLVTAARWAIDHREVLRDLPVWLFSSGPVAAGPLPAEQDAVLIEGVTADLGARGHRLFGGRLVQAHLTPPELAIVRAFRVPDIDARDLPAARAWGGAIAAELTGTGNDAVARPAEPPSDSRRA
jgi:menaquinone-dependent protoporphyrinogen oxidase